MATTNKKASNGRQRVTRSDSESARWISGLVIIFIALFMAASVLFSYFCWEGDQSGLQLSTEERETLGVTPENMCGWLGARVGMWLVDQSFGLFGLLLPIIVLLLGVRVIRKRPPPLPPLPPLFFCTWPPRSFISQTSEIKIFII